MFGDVGFILRRIKLNFHTLIVCTNNSAANNLLSARENEGLLSVLLLNDGLSYSDHCTVGVKRAG
jgi:hypothetical protein